MAQRGQEYRWYQIGCTRLGQPPLSEEAFQSRWQEFEDYAERLKAAEESGTVPELDGVHRAEMQQRWRNDPFVRAVLVGMAETPEEE